MSYYLSFSDQSKSDIEFYKKSGNKVVLRKIFILLEELSEHPFSGTGKPEALKHNLNGLWSRRINLEHRLVYEVTEDAVQILSAKGHYK